MKRIYTIGHSNKPFEHLVERLRKHGILTVIDVRSKPFSRYNPHFNAMELREKLPNRGIEYEWHGRHLGGMPPDRSLWNGARPNYAAIRASEPYQDDFEHLIHRLAYQEVAPIRLAPAALMCSEQDPTDCHRRRLLGADLIKQGFEILHILGDGTIATEHELREGIGENQPSVVDLFGGS